MGKHHPQTHNTSSISSNTKDNIISFALIATISFLTVIFVTLSFFTFRFFTASMNTVNDNEKITNVKGSYSRDFYHPEVVEPDSNNSLIQYDGFTGKLGVKSGARILFQEKPDSPGLSICTITVISPEYALTAGHCGSSKYGNKDYTIEYQEDGQKKSTTVAHIQENWRMDESKNPFSSRMDVTLLKFADGIYGVTNTGHDVSPHSLHNGDKVTTYGTVSGANYGHIVSKDQFVDNKSVLKDNSTTIMNNIIHKGDSGGPVYNDQGEVVGIINFYFTTNGQSGMTSIDKIFRTLRTLPK